MNQYLSQPLSALVARVFAVFMFAWFIPLVAHSQESDSDSWSHLRKLEGTWQGAIEGGLGIGRGLRTYEFILKDRYLFFRHSSIRLPQEASPKGDNHKEISIFSFDQEREIVVLRQFVVEGFVNEYDCTLDADSVVCTSTRTEGASGIRSRIIIRFQNPYSFVETFELGWPGKEMQMLFDNNRWTRVPASE